jgi:hypothetical protein
MIHIEDFSSPHKNKASEEKHEWKIKKALDE